MRIVYCDSFWAQNIGNGIFGLGVDYILKTVFGRENVTTVYDLQTYVNGYGKRFFTSKNAMDYISVIDADYIVLSGPVISRYFLPMWKNTLINLHKRGIGYMIVSAGVMKCDENTVKECREFFREYPPFVLSTRDEQTYNLFHEYATHSYNGICGAFFIPNAYSPAPTSAIKPTLVVNFDKIPEPEISLTPIPKSDFNFKFNDDEFYIRFSGTGMLSRAGSKTDRFSDALIYATSILPSRPRPAMIGKYTVIRTDHRYIPHYRSKIYKYCNSVCSDLPHTYINIYANADLTLSDRVHACATTLAYGNTAMCIVKTNRISLLNRVGATDVCRRPVKIDMDMLDSEKKKLLDWLGNIDYTEGKR